jgi:threonine dehydratase
MNGLTIADVRAAHERIAPHVVRTPALSVDHGAMTIIAKPESLQPIGAFKLRGAFNMMIASAPMEGVVAHSSGNHAQAVARAAKTLGVPATIVMPSNAPPLKRERVESDGAEIVTVGPDSEERRIEAERIATERGWLLVPPYDHPLVAAGQGTAALELIEDAPTFDRFYCPMSGGGLMAGCATVVSELTGAEIIGVEPRDADDTARSLQAGERVAVPPPPTIADGLRVRIPGEWTWTINRERVDRVALVSDAEMLDAMKWAAMRLRLVLEPSGAASLAAALREGSERCAVLLSGGNASARLLTRALGQKRGFESRS